MFYPGAGYPAQYFPLASPVAFLLPSSARTRTRSELVAYTADGPARHTVQHTQTSYTTTGPQRLRVASRVPRTKTEIP